MYGTGADCKLFSVKSKPVCMHVYGLPVGASKLAGSLDEIRTPRPQQIDGLRPEVWAPTWF
jgi:hypothetical protein